MISRKTDLLSGDIYLDDFTVNQLSSMFFVGSHGPSLVRTAFKGIIRA